MATTGNLGNFFQENKKLAKEYFDIRQEIYRLRFIRFFSRSAGYMIWIIISLFLVFLLFIFLGLVTGFWLSDLTGSYVKGFGIATLILCGVIILLALLRNVLFVNPLIRSFIRRANDADDEGDLTKSA